MPEHAEVPISYPLVFSGGAKLRIKDGAGSTLLAYPFSNRLEINIPSRQQTFCGGRLVSLVQRTHAWNTWAEGWLSTHPQDTAIVCNAIDAEGPRASAAGFTTST